MPLLIGIAVIVLGLLILGVIIKATLGLVGLLATLALAGFIGWAADQIIPGELPYGWLGAVLAGFVGGLVGNLLPIPQGPAILGIHLLPTFIGALLVVGAVEYGGRALKSGPDRPLLE